MSHVQLQRRMHLTMSSKRVGDRNIRPKPFSLAISCSSWNSRTTLSSSTEIRSILLTRPYKKSNIMKCSVGPCNIVFESLALLRALAYLYGFSCQSVAKLTLFISFDSTYFLLFNLWSSQHSIIPYFLPNINIHFLTYLVSLVLLFISSSSCWVCYSGQNLTNEEKQKQKQEPTRIASWSWVERESVPKTRITRASEGGDWEMETGREVEGEEERRKGRWKVLETGSQRLGAIMKRPWLHTTFSRSNANASLKGRRRETESEVWCWVCFSGEIDDGDGDGAASVVDMVCFVEIDWATGNGEEPL